ncbi:hypothetical protein GCM10007338_05950 [Corynebacterium pelargi]|nr:hypothetical protein GCM10007338_05950 [Corynebacterium pelargi]
MSAEQKTLLLVLDEIPGDRFPRLPKFFKSTTPEGLAGQWRFDCHNSTDAQQMCCIWALRRLVWQWGGCVDVEKLKFQSA